ncbi:MAG: hypothetical protein QOF10_1352 [Kribbellaceae bacterium]|jgi:hypothetical protein|nr:hypothetical protein [Kribbellaceae bacterium]
MTDLHHPPRSAARRRKSVAAPVQKSSAMPLATPTATPSSPHPQPIDVQVQIGGRWIAGQALTRRDDEILVSHHGHLVWVDEQQVRTP